MTYSRSVSLIPAGSYESLILSITSFDGYVTSKVFGKTRTQDSQPQNGLLDNLQMCQNKMLRTLEGVKISDKIRSEVMLKKNNFLSVNQTMAQIKMTEMWKTVNTKNNPLDIKQRGIPENGRTTRSDTQGNFHNTGKSTLSQNSFIEDSKRVWNKTPCEIKTQSRYGQQRNK